jgi:hypothetical protein
LARYVSEDLDINIKLMIPRNTYRTYVASFSLHAGLLTGPALPFRASIISVIARFSSLEHFYSVKKNRVC